MAAIQLDNSNYSKTQARLETQLYVQEQDMSKLRKEIQQLTKAKKDTEKKLITEVSFKLYKMGIYIMKTSLFSLKNMKTKSHCGSKLKQNSIIKFVISV
jgi:septal ring factor EnvC (AmiA/AmiB activator)